MKHHRTRGFTLIEALLTASIVAMLTAVAIPVAMTVLDRGYVDESRNEMVAMRTALQLYVGDTGDFPDGLDDLLSEPVDAPAGWDGPYMVAGNNANGLTMELVDGWGTPYDYYAVEGDNDNRYLRSLGPNRHDDGGSGDDIIMKADVSEQRRSQTKRELELLNDAIQQYNLGNLPHYPLPEDMEEVVDILLADDYLPDGSNTEEFLTDAWGKSYEPGATPVQEVFLAGSGNGTPGGPPPKKGKKKKVEICHIPPGNPAARHTIEVGESAVAAHLAHGDTLGSCCPIIIDFETEDDMSTPIVDGQDISTPPEFGELIAISSTGPNYGPALFDSSMGGPNNPGRDDDLLVGLGNVLMLQENNTQSVAGIYDFPDDDGSGGTLIIDFLMQVEVSSVTLIDVDAGNQGATVTLITQNGKTRIYDCPGGFTEDIASEGPPGYRLLDLTTLDPQPGYTATATAAQSPGFKADKVVRMEVSFQSSGALDNIAFCPK